MFFIIDLREYNVLYIIMYSLSNAKKVVNGINIFIHETNEIVIDKFIALTLENITFENSFKLAILTLTNTTNSALYGLEDLNFFDFNNFTKISLIIFMTLGKIEIIAILFLLRKFIF